MAEALAGAPSPTTSGPGRTGYPALSVHRTTGRSHSGVPASTKLHRQQPPQHHRLETEKMAPRRAGELGAFLSWLNQTAVLRPCATLVRQLIYDSPKRRRRPGTPDTGRLPRLKLGSDPLWLRRRLSAAGPPYHRAFFARGRGRGRPTFYLSPEGRPGRPVAPDTLSHRLNATPSASASGDPATALSWRWSAKSSGKSSPTCSESPTMPHGAGTTQAAATGPATSLAACGKIPTSPHFPPARHETLRQLLRVLC